MDSDVPALESNLRSAYLLRETHADVAATPSGPDERQIRLVRHFGQVLELLAANGQRSLELALNRLPRHRGEEWSAAQRAEWRQVLAWRRFVNMRRLWLYQQRGRFPLNEHVSDRTVPIFVDNHNTACAVGHPMRESGWPSRDRHSTGQ
jgi:hypothetical protein